MSCKPIGFFDSGVGGISVLKTAYQRMPNENYIYYGDNLNAPYGEKSEQQIKALSLAAGAFLFSKGVKAIVMACNTATSAAVIMMREKYSIPVISMEPAVKPALEKTQGRVLVLATPATVSQARYLGLLERLGANGRVVSVGCGGLVELVEQGRTDEISIHDYLRRRLSGLDIGPVSAVVLGCTHYSFIEKQIKSYIDAAYGIDCPVFDGRHGTARYLQQVLTERALSCPKTQRGSITFYSSDPRVSSDSFKALFERF